MPSRSNIARKAQRNKVKQTRLAFGSTSSAMESSPEHEALPTPVTSSEYEHASSTSPGGENDVDFLQSSHETGVKQAAMDGTKSHLTMNFDGGNDLYEALSHPSSKTPRSKLTNTNMTNTVDSDSDEPLSSQAKGRRAAGTFQGGSAKKSVNMSSATRGLPATRTLRAKTTPSKSQQFSSAIADDSGDDILPSSRGEPSSRPSTSQSRSDRKRPSVTEFAFTDDEDSDELPENPTPRLNINSPKAVATSSRLQVTIPVSEEDDDDEEPISPQKRCRSRIRFDSESELEEESPAKRRREVVPVGSDAENDSDLVSLKGKTTEASSLATPSRVTRRQRQPRKHRTEREKKLELMKRKRAGEKIEQVTDSEIEDDVRPTYDPSSDHEVLDYFEDEEADDEEPEKVEVAQSLSKEKGKGPARSHSASNLNEYEEEGIDDTDARLGVPTVLPPLKFTSAACKPEKEFFKDVVSWMIHNKLNPAFERNNELYNIAFKKMDDRPLHYANKFNSNQFTAEFKRVLDARPAWVERRFFGSVSVDDLCEPCNHKRHPPKFAIRFTGRAYHKKSLEDVDQGRDEDESEDSDGHDSSSESSDHPSVNENGQTIVGEDVEWLSGKFCFANAQQAHTLTHWRYHLNERVLEILEKMGELEPDMAVKREKLNAKNRWRYTDHIVDIFEQDGSMKQLFKERCQMMKEAIEGEVFGQGFRNLAES